MARTDIKVCFLGTNGWYDTDTGNTICILIETAKEYVVLDAGNGIYKLDQHIKDNNKPIHLFLSHFHLDHIEGMHILAKFKFKQGITIYVQKGGKRILDRIVRQPYTLAIKDLKTKVKIKGVEGARKVKFLADVKSLLHISRCIGFRFDFGGKIISYIPDTGLCKNALKLAERADLLIAECAFKAGQNSDEWPHLNPETAAELAREAKAKRLALVHFDAEVYQTIAERKQAERQARKIFGETIAAQDGMVIEIGGK